MQVSSFVQGTIAALLFSFNPTAIAFAQTLDAEVVSVGDGDTLRASVAGETVTVRLSCIDAPETAQTPWGLAARDRLKQLLQQGDRVELRVETTDRYGRTVAEIFERGVSVNLQLVEEGQAVVYRKYLSGCSETSDRYLEAEAQARDRRLGYWNQNDPVMPWDFRKGERATNAPEQPQGVSQSFQQTGNCDPSYPDICLPSAPDLDCGEIAHRNFRVVGNDPHRFDRDRDGIGCEG